LGRPVIATDVGDLRLLIEKYNVGLVVPPADPKRLATAITSFIAERRAYAAGCAACAAELDVDRASDRFADWLRNHLAHRMAPHLETVC
jgi:glycosyltransferase involved in cell wall biosynthesis